MKTTLIAAAIAAALGAAGAWYVTSNHYESVLADKELAIAQAQQRAESSALFAQTQSSLAISQIDATYQDKLHEKDATHDRDLAAVRAGTLRLRDASAKCPSAVPAGTGTSSGDGETGAELSPAATEFLLGLADDADGVALQLGACQAVIENDRKVVDQLFKKDPE
jgi:hypothetical protein